MALYRVAIVSTLCLTATLLLGFLELPFPHPASNRKALPFTSEQIEYLSPSPLSGVFKPNTALQSTQKILEKEVSGCETVLPTADGKRVYIADKYGKLNFADLIQREDGKISAILNQKNSLVADVGPERPLGLGFDKDNNILVCSSVKGLLIVNRTTSEVSILSDRVSVNSRIDPNTKITFANDVTISSKNGDIYFTESTDIPVVYDKKYGFYSTMNSFKLNLFEAKKTGRLLKYDVNTKKTHVLLKDLWFPNGVALSEDESFVTFVETLLLRVCRYWLTGPKAGTTDILISNLHGYPDGMSMGSDGNFWIAIVISANTPLKYLIKYQSIRTALAWFHEIVEKIFFKPFGCVIKVDASTGQVLNTLMDVEGGFISHVSSVYESGNKLFLGNLHGDYISIFNLELLKQISSDNFVSDEL